MTKLLATILLTTIIIVTTNCGGDGPPAPDFNPNDTIPKAMALAMYAHYMDSTVNKDDTAIIRMIYPPVSSLSEILKTKDLVKVNFIVAAYLDTDPVVERRNRPMVLLQLKTEKAGVITYYYYDLSETTKEASALPPYCPPPPCPPES